MSKKALDDLGVAIADAGYTWTPEMRSAYEKGVRKEWVGLTDEEAWGIYRTHGLSFHRPNHVEEYEWSFCMRDFAHAIEAKLKDKNT
jgi:hypothetical protein